MGEKLGRNVMPQGRGGEGRVTPSSPGQPPATASLALRWSHFTCPESYSSPMCSPPWTLISCKIDLEGVIFHLALAAQSPVLCWSSPSPICGLVGLLLPSFLVGLLLLIHPTSFCVTLLLFFFSFLPPDGRPCGGHIETQEQLKPNSSSYNTL